MKTYTITKKNFLQWYFKTGADCDQKEMVYDLGKTVLDLLFNNEDAVITTDDIFLIANLDCIPLSYLEEFKNDEDNHNEYGEDERINDNDELILID